MADGPSADDAGSSTLNMKPPTEHTYAITRFQNKAYAANLCCIECGHVPRQSHADLDQTVYCKACGDLAMKEGRAKNVTISAFGDKLISKAQIACATKLEDPDRKEDEKSEGAEGSQACEWIGPVKDLAPHIRDECKFTKVKCGNECKCEWHGSRSLLEAHRGVCDFGTIDCPLSCPLKILRKDTEDHTKNRCAKTVMKCTNATCTVEVVRELLTQHETQECTKRIVECPYHQYGCSQENVMFEAMEQHLTDFQIKHLQFQLNSLYAMLQQQQKDQQQRPGAEHGLGGQFAGMIQMFGGDVDDVPKGWMVCNGANGTPDLRAKFVLKSKNATRNGTTKGKLPSKEMTIDDADELAISEIDEDEDYQDIEEARPRYSMVYIMKH